jgi:L-malate glycosyltransferase
VIPNGFDLDRFVHSRTYGDRLNIGFVSCLNGKLEDDFPALVKNALSRVTNPHKFIVVGDGSSLPHFRSCANALAWPVRFDGMRWDVDRALAEMDVFLYPTRNYVLPTVVIEAMASGLPVVSPPVGEIPAMLADGRGYALTWGDMPDVLANLCADSGLREHIGQSAQRYALSNYSHGAMLERHLALYEEIINGD